MKTLPADGRLLALDETTLRQLPPLRAAWALRGQQAEVRISGKNARRSLFGTVDLRTGRRVVMIRPRQRLADYHAFLRRLRHGVGACGALWLLLDRHGSHCHPSSLRPGRTTRHPPPVAAAPASQTQPGRSSLARTQEHARGQPPVRQRGRTRRLRRKLGAHADSCPDFVQSRVTLTKMLAQRSTQNTLLTYLVFLQGSR